MSLLGSRSFALAACLAFLLWLPGPFSTAGPLSPDSVQPASGAVLLQRLAEQGRRLKGLQSRFRQTRSVAFMNEQLSSEGFFQYKAPGFLLWEYTAPLTFRLEYNNGEARFRSAFDGKSAPQDGTSPNRHEAALAAGLARHIMVWMSMDMDKIRALYTVTVLSVAPLSLQLTPLKTPPGSPLRDMEVTFAANNLDVERLLLRDKDGDFTRLDFFDTRREE